MAAQCAAMSSTVAAGVHVARVDAMKMRAKRPAPAA